MISSSDFCNYSPPTHADTLQAQIDLTRQRGQVSQSFQIAPFDNGYWPVSNSSANWISYDEEEVVVNSYRGGVYQQALSHLAYVDDDVFVGGGGDFGVYGEFSVPSETLVHIEPRLTRRLRILCQPQQPR